MILIENGTGGFRAVSPTWRDMLAARLFGARLDADLAAGMSPDLDVRHALRARMLISSRTRAELVRTLDQLTAGRRGRVLPAIPPARARELRATRDVVAGTEPVSARGMAMVRQLIGDAANGLYDVGPVRPELPELLARISREQVGVPSG